MTHSALAPALSYPPFQQTPERPRPLQQIIANLAGFACRQALLAVVSLPKTAATI